MNKESFAKRMRKAMEIRDMKQVDIVKRTGLTRSAVSQYYNGMHEPKQRAIFSIAQALNVSEAWLMGLDVPMVKPHKALIPIKTKKIPMLGRIAAGEPILSTDIGMDLYIEADEGLRVDYCLRVQGDSMIDARINDGDLVFIREQPCVENGEIAAVLIDDEVTLKRFYKNNGGVILKPENSMYQPFYYTEADFKDVRILGKAVFFQSEI